MAEDPNVKDLKAREEGWPMIIAHPLQIIVNDVKELR